ncbi:lipase member H-A-like [Tropilaelaps mercedesae]|uniref:Lipase member H-A-like n=1 Tax=Tropilaelaps mercedesae TaxID=418985 RepID=A0A1V9X201_9ACAR|nr:lipase member H-A-like [Tropilaelaps mercedesae]
MFVASRKIYFRSWTPADSRYSKMVKITSSEHAIQMSARLSVQRSGTVRRHPVGINLEINGTMEVPEGSAIVRINKPRTASVVHPHRVLTCSFPCKGRSLIMGRRVAPWGLAVWLICTWLIASSGAFSLGDRRIRKQLNMMQAIARDVAYATMKRAQRSLAPIFSFFFSRNKDICFEEVGKGCPETLELQDSSGVPLYAAKRRHQWIVGCFNDSFIGAKPSSPKKIDVYYSFNTAEKQTNLTWNAKDKTIRSNLVDMFDGRTRLVLQAHGFGANSAADWNKELTDLLLEAYPGENVVVMLIDWRKGAATPLYNQASANVQVVARLTVNWVRKLQKLFPNSIAPEDIHFIGFSLGGQMSGYFARDYFNATSRKRLQRVEGYRFYSYNGRFNTNVFGDIRPVAVVHGLMRYHYVVLLDT